MRSRIVAGIVIVTAGWSASACTQVLGGFDFTGKPGTGGASSASVSGSSVSGSGGAGGTSTSSGGTSSSSGTGGTTSSTTASTSSTSSTTTTASSSSGVPMCTGGETMCGSTCVNLQTTATDCGKCGHDCQHGLCSAGACQPWVLAANRSIISSLDADGTYVVWSENGPSYQVTAAGTNMTQFTPTPTYGPGVYATGPVLRNGTVAYVSTFSSFNEVFTVAEGQTMGTFEATIPSTYPYRQSIALNPAASIAYLFVTTNATPYATSNSLLSCPLNGATCTVATNIGGYTTIGSIAEGGLVVNSTYAFWSVVSPATELARFPLAGGPIVTFPTSVSAGPALDGTSVYWVGTPNYTIYALPQTFTSGSVPVNMGNRTNQVSGLATDGTNVYFGEQNITAATSLYYIPVGGHTATPIYASPYAGSSERDIVAVGGALYWVEINFAACPATSSILGIATP